MVAMGQPPHIDRGNGPLGLSIRLVVIGVLAILLALFITWFVGNLLYDVLLAYLQAHGWPEARMIAYILAHTVPFFGAICCVVGIYALLRYEVVHGDLRQGIIHRAPHAVRKRTVVEGRGIRIPPFPWRAIWKGIRYGSTALHHAVRRALEWTYYYVPRLNYEIADAVGSTDLQMLAYSRASAEFFWHRFGDAFPALREPREYTDISEIAHRMGLLLRDPIAAATEDGDLRCPLWWTRGLQDFYVERWVRLKPNVFLLNQKELRVSRILAIP